MIRSMSLHMLILFLLLICINHTFADKFEQTSGGPLSPLQATYNVTFYDLDLSIDPDNQTIAGSNTVYADVIAPLEQFILNLDYRLTVDSVLVNGTTNRPIPAGFKQLVSILIIDFPEIRQPGDKVVIRVFYHGKPLKAAMPPWDGGFSWKKTASGEHWIGVACETEGADVWWPCKDHPSDEPDSMSLRFTVPEDLVCVSNGRLRDEFKNKNGTKTFQWFVSIPINNYGVSVYIAPYKTIQTNYKSVTGELFPVTLWYIPRANDLPEKFFPYITKHLRFLENTLGPYPFRTEKYGVAETSYLGMEHQTIIAYGDIANTRGHMIHFHELAHEWWGNLVTAADWKDLWLHEGFATYMEALYDEAKYGSDRYFSHFGTRYKNFRNETPIAPLEPKTTTEIYGNEIYTKGAYILHSLRYLIGKENLLKSFRRFLYPDSTCLNNTDGSCCRLVTTGDYIETVNDIAHSDLNWFFQAYLRTAALPRLAVIYKYDELEMYWNSRDNPDFFMPVDIVTADNDTIRIDMSDGHAVVPVTPNTKPEIDPLYRVLKETVVSYDPSFIAHSINKPDRVFLEQNYPNPFNNSTKITCYLPKENHIKMTVYNIQGRLVRELINERHDAGWFSVQFDADNLPSGLYFYKIEAGSFHEIKSCVLLR